LLLPFELTITPPMIAVSAKMATIAVEPATLLDFAPLTGALTAVGFEAGAADAATGAPTMANAAATAKDFLNTDMECLLSSEIGYAGLSIGWIAKWRNRKKKESGGNSPLESINPP